MFIYWARVKTSEDKQQNQKFRIQIASTASWYATWSDNGQDEEKYSYHTTETEKNAATEICLTTRKYKRGK